ncbi:hypothetical protein EDD18DRAFT_1344118 [Armillaria luteobubalina]|uniref:Uncharacterized protein n=1 Tax=Armillaria luteobubalina TaxID=153913 RepID=A0AA39QN15_9AGAR|nr:hypothetical protein EDD18DRAFT_1344118 [Armillaria luteobubalina]
MTEQTRNIGFTAATGFGYDEEIYLTQNATHYHILESGEFAALSDLWLETIWQQHVLYWPPNDHSDDGLIAHRKRVQHALRWLYDALDPDACEEQLTYAAAHEAKVYPPVQAPITRHVRRINVIEPPTPREIAKSLAIKAAKFTVTVCLRRWKELEECRTRCLARGQYIRRLRKPRQNT